MDKPAKNNSTDIPSIKTTRNILVKTIGLFVIANLLFTMFYPMSLLGKLSIYNWLVPGRVRLPYGDNPATSYNLSLFNLDAMFASHELVASDKPDDEFRVIFIGDSSTWGYLLPPDQTLTAQINYSGATLPDGRKIKAFNLGYPVMSLAKDLLILDFALQYEPDLIVWPVTLESFPNDKQYFAPLLQNNPLLVKSMIEKYDLNLDLNSVKWIEPSPLVKTIIGSRRPLADLIRLQIFGILWAATGIDHEIPESYPLRQEDLEADRSFHDLIPPRLIKSDLAMDMISAGIKAAGEIPVLLINEPMYISQGKNSDIRYNFYYPRWAYDSYRQLIQEESSTNQWNYLDLGELVPASEFTNTAVHMTPQGTRLFADRILEEIQKQFH